MSGRLTDRRPSRLQKLTLIAAALGGVWTIFILLSGGVEFTLLGVRVRSHDWRDAAAVTLVSLLVLAWLRRASIAEWGRVRAAAAIGWLTIPGNALLVAILAAAAFVRFWALNFGLPHPAARPDEEAIGALAGSYLSGTFRPTDFTYPPLFPLLVALASWLSFWRLPATLRAFGLPFEPGDPTTSAQRILARVLGAAAGVFSVWLLFRIARRLFGDRTALVAAAFLALAFLHVRDSHFGVTDVPMTCMVLAGFLAILKMSESGTRRDLLIAGICTGLAVATKYNAGLLALPACYAILAGPGPFSMAHRVGRAAAFVAIMTCTFLIVCPFALIDYRTFVEDLIEVGRHLREGHGPDLGRGWIHHLTITLRYGLGLPLLTAGIVGLVLMVWREGYRGVLVMVFPVAYYVVSGSGRTVFARHALPLVPFLCLSAAYLVSTAANGLVSHRRRPPWRAAAAAVLTALVLLPSALSIVAFSRVIAREDSRAIARRWIESRFAAGTTILQLGQTNGHVYIYYEPRYVLSQVPSAFRPTLVVLVSSPLAAPHLDSIAPWVKREYDLQFAQQVVSEDDGANIYDRQDEFFVPLSGFHDIERPGPNLHIYVRRDDVAGTPARGSD